MAKLRKIHLLNFFSISIAIFYQPYCVGMNFQCALLNGYLEHDQAKNDSSLEIFSSRDPIRYSNELEMLGFSSPYRPRSFCPCQQTSAITKPGLEHHIGRHHFIDEIKRHYCYICLQVFTYQADVVQHFSADHQLFSIANDTLVPYAPRLAPIPKQNKSAPIILPTIIFCLMAKCGKKFVTAQGVFNHLNGEHDMNFFTETPCGEEIVEMEGITIHRISE